MAELLAPSVARQRKLLGFPLVDSDISATANINATKIGTGVVSNTEFDRLNGITSALEEQGNKGAVSGYAGLDASQLLLLTNFPAGSGLQVLRRNAGNTALEFATPASAVTSINADTTAAQIIAAGTGLGIVDAGATHTLSIDSTVVTLTGAQILTNKTLTTPTIASFVNATHNHSNAAGGGNLTNTALTSGVFGAITGVGVQAQALDMNTQILQFVDANQTITNSGGNLIYDVAIGQVHLWRINNVTEMQLSATALAMQGNAVLQVGFLTSFAAVPSTAGTIRLGNAQSIDWRNAGNTANFGITGNASDQIAIDADLNIAGNNIVSAVMTGTVTGVSAITGLGTQTQELIMGANFIDISEIATPANPAANVGRLHVKDVAAITTLFFRDSAGTETDLLAGGATLATQTDVLTSDFTTTSTTLVDITGFSITIANISGGIFTSTTSGTIKNSGVNNVTTIAFDDDGTTLFNARGQVYANNADVAISSTLVGSLDGSVIKIRAKVSAGTGTYVGGAAGDNTQFQFNTFEVG